MVYDTRYGAWSVHSGYNQIAYRLYRYKWVGKSLLWGDNQEMYLKMETGYSDNGTAINSYVKSH